MQILFDESYDIIRFDLLKDEVAICGEFNSSNTNQYGNNTVPATDTKSKVELTPAERGLNA